MARAYTLKKRAEQQAETRRRIVEAAVDLHTDLGPARTTLSMIAEKAGVQRHTLYAHFPDERALQMACSGLVFDRDALPDAEPWRELPAGGERLSHGLRALYGWYDRNEAVTAAVLRDAEYHAQTRETVGVRFGPYFSVYNEVLGEGLTLPQRALLHLALVFHTWRSLVREAKLDQEQAVEVMVKAIRSN